jgi:hypothetical protein
MGTFQAVRGAMHRSQACDFETGIPLPSKEADGRSTGDRPFSSISWLRNPRDSGLDDENIAVPRAVQDTQHCREHRLEDGCHGIGDYLHFTISPSHPGPLQGFIAVLRATCSLLFL